MSSFTNRLKYVHVGGGVYMLTEPFTFYFNDDLTGEYVHVPVGFRSNGASIPKCFQTLFNWNPMSSEWVQASFLHDGLVGEFEKKLQVCTDGNLKGRYLSWNESADWFDKALKVRQDHVVECPHLNRTLFVSSVKMYGRLKCKK